MRKKIFYVYLCILMMAVTAFQVTGNLNNVKTVEMESDNFCNSVEENLVKGSVSSDWLEKKLLASDGSQQDFFGKSVCIDGDLAFIGAEEAGSYGAGAVYVFKNNDTLWTEQQILVASDPCGGDFFGCSVCFDDNFAIIGAYGNNENGFSYGSAYIFQLVDGVWYEKQILLAPDGATEDCFGYSVSISGSYAIVGSYADDDMGSDSGSAYVYKRDGSTWTLMQKLNASDGTAGDYFSWSVSISGDAAVVGAYKHNGGIGAVYVFKCEGSTWIQQQKITPSDASTWVEFGRSVSIDGECIIAGAPVDDDYGYCSGSAYIFRNNGSSWIEEQKLTDSEGEEGDLFGWSVSIKGDYAVIGAPADDGTIGSAHVFKNDVSGWFNEKKLTTSDDKTSWYGSSVSTDGNNFLIGAKSSYDFGAHSGSAYVYMRDTEDQNPAKPSIDGPPSGKAGTSYDYTFMTTDPNDDDVYYYIEWGDGEIEEWIGPYSSGEVVTINHTWDEQGTYAIKAKAKDINNHESLWGTLEVSMPKNRISSNPVFLRFLERLMQRFTILNELVNVQ